MKPFLFFAGAAWLTFAILNENSVDTEFFWMALLPMAFVGVIFLLRDS